MNLSLIAAIGKNYELGKNNDLIWHIKGDMKFFKETTMGHPVVMGKNTYDSLPKILPGRKNIVISRSMEDINKEIQLFRSIKAFLKYYEDYKDEIFVIGGATIYTQLIDYANKLYLTEIDKTDNSADTFFPRFNLDEWDGSIISQNTENDINYSHVLYKKNK